MGMLAGGWASAKLDDTSVVDAAKYCVSALLEAKDEHKYSFAPTLTAGQYKLQVVKASTQVVAGLNIEFTAIVKKAGAGSEEGGECLGAFSARVWDHFGEYSVTDWYPELSCDQALALLTDDTDAGEGI
eukprot:Nitzschia sp. Nitz4//scaffold74_size92883//91642//92028//NITZ4_004835-RA/size92883-processed-gene-0.87-mRNA-1//-1//CDS//3329557631//1383//frame0